MLNPVTLRSKGIRVLEQIYKNTKADSNIETIMKIIKLH
uniref:Uncharacterized protein n=1 Tax=Rhizophora mucronata TaxID=61149 RepID=A0A2P2PRU4_RHIMU